MVLSPYFSDADLINSLRACFSRDEQYTIDFHFWLSTAKLTSEGFIIQVKSRRFLIDKMVGCVIREL